MDDSAKNNFRDVENYCEYNELVADEDSNESEMADSLPSPPDTENHTLWDGTGSSAENMTDIFKHLSTINCTLTEDELEVHCSLYSVHIV